MLFFNNIMLMKFVLFLAIANIYYMVETCKALPKKEGKAGTFWAITTRSDPDLNDGNLISEFIPNITKEATSQNYGILHLTFRNAYVPYILCKNMNFAKFTPMNEGVSNYTSYKISFKGCLNDDDKKQKFIKFKADTIQTVVKKNGDICLPDNSTTNDYDSHQINLTGREEGVKSPIKNLNDYLHYFGCTNAGLSKRIYHFSANCEKLEDGSKTFSISIEHAETVDNLMEPAENFCDYIKEIRLDLGKQNNKLDACKNKIKNKEKDAEENKRKAAEAVKKASEEKKKAEETEKKEEEEEPHERKVII